MSSAYRDWTRFLQACMDETGEVYHPLQISKLVGLYTLILVKASLRPRISSLDHAQLKRGLGGHHGNKVHHCLEVIAFGHCHC